MSAVGPPISVIRSEFMGTSLFYCADAAAGRVTR
jgi:hypothetical protein